jgi:cytochrome c oxidase subunit II
VPFRQVFWGIFPLESIIAGVVFGLVVMAMAAAVLVSRRKRRQGAPAARREHWHTVEGAFGLALAGMAAFLAVASFSANARDFPRTSAKPALRVQVTAFQWCWSFHYAGQPVTVTGSCQDGQYPLLVLPVGEPVEFDVTSVDVVHAFWVPYLDTKMDAFPGHVDTFTVTLPHDGRWLGRCAQFCGLYHYEMDFYLQVIPRGQFTRWLHARASAAAGTGKAAVGTGTAAGAVK